MTAKIRRATLLRPGQFKHLIEVASVTGRLPERDVLLWLTHITRPPDGTMLISVLIPFGKTEHGYGYIRGSAGMGGQAATMAAGRLTETVYSRCLERGGS